MKTYKLITPDEKLPSKLEQIEDKLSDKIAAFMNRKLATVEVEEE